MNYKAARTPEDIPELFVEYWNLKDGSGIASLFKDNAEFVNVVGLWWHNKTDIEKAHKYGLEVIFKESTLKLTRVKKRILTENIVILHAKFRLTGQTPIDSIQQPQDRYNIFTFVCTRAGDSWLCEAAHNTDIVPGKETNIVTATGKFRSVDYRK